MKETFLSRILDIIYPAKCGYCGEITGTTSFICNKCWPLVNQEYTNRCKFCGKISERKVCPECTIKSICYEKLIFCNEYTEKNKKIMHEYKFYDKKFHYNFFVELLFDKLKNESADMLIPVPISKERYRERGYNQSAIIAKKLAKKLKMEYNGDILIKVKNSERQSIQNFKKRQENIKNLFSIADNISIVNKSVILIDDIFATGATANECARVLKKAGVKNIKIAVIYISHILK